MLVDTEVPEYQLSPALIATVTALSALVLVVVLGIVWRAQRRPVASGGSGMIGARAEVLDWQDGHGHVRAHGERWAAEGPPGLAPGNMVDIAAMRGLTLTVRRPAPDTAPETGPSKAGASP
jgi:membrane-bound serine protease (ClpP class)